MKKYNYIIIIIIIIIITTIVLYDYNVITKCAVF